jgi:3-deoxy-7-phosphoheptulonate synthase
MLTFTKKIITAEQLKKELPLNETIKSIKESADKELADIIKSKGKFLIVCGPCSADNEDAVIEYAKNLGKLAERVKSKITTVLRVFTAKPRSLGEGYLGMLFSQKDGKADINYGLRRSRSLMIECIKASCLPIADELLYFEQCKYLGDLVSYYFLGARTSESTPHRNLASGLDIPVGIKNPTGGSLISLAEAIYCVQTPKTLIWGEEQYQTSGNSLAHAVLRGLKDDKGCYKSNLNKAAAQKLIKNLSELNIKDTFILADCSHGNSGKKPSRQVDNAINAVENKLINGIMLESYLVEGCGEGYGLSKTDPCISFEQTEQLFMQIFDMLP